MKTNCTPEERAILDAWPVVTAEDIERMNDLFLHYIFYRPDKTGISLWTSCCGRTERLNYLRRTELPTEIDLLTQLGHNEKMVCPWCGQDITLKDLRKSGKRKQLEQYKLAILLHAGRDALYADAVVLNKEYSTEDLLTAKPTYLLSNMYRFAAGDVMEVDYQVFRSGWVTHERKTLGKRKLVQEPFKSGSISCYTHGAYAIVNREALQECPVTRYSGYFEHWTHCVKQRYFYDFVSYVTAYCMYPRPVEMLVKAGLYEPVRALIFNRKKFADVINWSEPDIRKGMRLTRQELREVLERKPCMEALELRNLARRWFEKGWTIHEAVEFQRLWCEGVVSGRYVLSFCRRYKLDPDRLVRYLEREQVVDPDLPWADISDVFQLYRDYIEMAWQLGMCMEHGKVLWPDDLRASHNLVSDQFTARQDEEITKLPVGKGAVDGAVRKQKYEFELDGLIIRFPLTSADIRYEGKVLNHCVGGYAERHIKGVLTILFLRQTEEPNRPYVTIEMDGNRIVQVHGYKNDLGGQSPKVIHKEFFDVWLAWLKAGSKRDKDGKPVLPKKRKAEAA